MDDVRQAARRVTVAIFFDFSKAFDNVRYLLINKLRHLGFSSPALVMRLFDYLEIVRNPVSRE